MATTRLLQAAVESNPEMCRSSNVDNAQYKAGNVLNSLLQEIKCTARITVYFIHK
jgi:hypothetical protein